MDQYKERKIIFCIVGIIMLSSLIYFRYYSNQDNTKSFLEEKGYTHVVVMPGSVLSCSEYERATRFIARDYKNKEVSGSVCRPVFLNPSIRLD